MPEKKPSKKRREKDAARLGGRAATLDQGQYLALKEEYQSESDRGAALLAAAYMEGALEEAIRRCLVSDELGGPLFDEVNGPLATLSAKLRLARALGVIPAMLYKDLDLVRSIRNDFAHHPDRLTFDTPSVRDRCAAMMIGGQVRELVKPRGTITGPAVPREFYFFTVGMAVSLMKVWTEKRPRPTEPLMRPVTLPPPKKAPSIHE